MPGDLRIAPRIISLSPVSLATDVTEATLGTSGLWLGTRTGSGGTATVTIFFLPQPMALWTTWISMDLQEYQLLDLTA